MKDDEIKKSFEEWESDHGHDHAAWNFRNKLCDIHALGFYAGYKSRDKELSELKEKLERKELNMQKISEGTAHIVSNRDKKMAKLEEKLNVAIEALCKIDANISDKRELAYQALLKIKGV